MKIATLIASIVLSFGLLVSADPDGRLQVGIKRAVPAEQCSRKTKKGDQLEMHYRGTLKATGEQFDASYDRGQPFSFQLGAGQVIKGWDQGLLDMCIGEARKLVIPPNLGYGKAGAGGIIPPDATLGLSRALEITCLANCIVFEVELLGIKGYTPPASNEDDIKIGGKADVNSDDYAKGEL